MIRSLFLFSFFLIQTSLIAAIVSIPKERLSRDLDSIVHHHLQSDDVSIKDPSITLFQTILSYAMAFDDTLQNTWGIDSSSASLTSSFTAEEPFAFWIQTETSLAHSVAVSLPGDADGVSALKLLVETLLMKLSHIPAGEAAIRYRDSVVLPTIETFLEGVSSPKEPGNWQEFRHRLDALKGVSTVMEGVSENMAGIDDLEGDSKMAAIVASAVSLERSFIEMAGMSEAQQFADETLETAFRTEHFTLGKVASDRVAELGAIVESGCQKVSEDLAAAREWLEPRDWERVAFCTLKTIDDEVKTRALLVHFDESGAEMLQGVLKGIYAMEQMNGLRRNPMKVETMGMMTCRLRRM